MDRQLVDPCLCLIPSCGSSDVAMSYPDCRVSPARLSTGPLLKFGVRSFRAVLLRGWDGRRVGGRTQSQCDLGHLYLHWKLKTPGSTDMGVRRCASALRYSKLPQFYHTMISVEYDTVYYAIA